MQGKSSRCRYLEPIVPCFAEPSLFVKICRSSWSITDTVSLMRVFVQHTNKWHNCGWHDSMNGFINFRAIREASKINRFLLFLFRWSKATVTTDTSHQHSDHDGDNIIWILELVDDIFPWIRPQKFLHWCKMLKNVGSGGQDFCFLF